MNTFLLPEMKMTFIFLDIIRKTRNEDEGGRPTYGVD